MGRIAFLLMCVAVSLIALAAAVSADDISVGTEPRRYEHLDESFYNSSFMSWAGSNDSDRLNLAAREAAHARAARLAEIGVTGVLHNGRHFRLSYPEEYDLMEKYGRAVVEACRRHDIKVVEHHEFTVFSYASYPTMLAHLDWLQTDIRTGEPWRWACIHNPGFLRAYGDYLASYAERAQPDGYMLDEVGFVSPNTCGCSHCREQYTSALGRAFPVWSEGGGSFDDAEFRNLVRWRSKLTPQAQQVVMDRIRDVRPDAMNMKYCSDYADPGPAARGWDLAVHAARYSPFMGWECMVAEGLNGWRPFLRGLKLRNSYGNFYDIPVWSLNREMTSREAVYFGWALCQAGKHSIWYGGRGLATDADLDYFARYNAWPHFMPHRHARCLTDTGVLISNQTRFTNPEHRLFWNEFRGWLDMLIMGNRQFDALLDGDLQYPARLRKYSVLLLVSQASLTDQQAVRLTEWVRDGGTAIVTGVTASRDGFGTVRDRNALADAMGVAPDGPDCQGGTVRLEGELNGLALDFEAEHGNYPAIVTDPERVRVLATMTDAEGRESPALAETRFGEGRFLYVGVDLGSANFEDKARNRWPLRGTWDADQQALIWSLYDYAHGRPAPASIKAPDGVIAVAYQEHGGEHEGRIHLHLLNMKGATAEPGYKFQYGRHEAIEWPAVKGEIVWRVQADLTGPAVARSPEFAGDRSVESARAGGATVIAIPASLLKGYLHVSAPAQPLPSQKPLLPPIDTLSGMMAQRDRTDRSDPTDRIDEAGNAGPWPLAKDSKVNPKGPCAFEIGAEDALEVRVGDHVLLSGDGLDLVDHEYTLPPGPAHVDTAATCRTNFTRKADGWTGVVSGGADGNGIVWARETAAYDDRLEVTFAAVIPPGDLGADAYAARYQLRIPCAVLKGAHYTARYGMHRTDRALKKGTFTGEEPEDAEVPFLSHVRFMQVEGGPVDFMFDVNPCGPWGLYVEDYSSSYKAHFFRQGDDYVVVMCTLDARWGTKLMNKVVFRLGRHDLQAIHPMHVTHYTYPFPVFRRIQFTPDAPVTGMAHREDLHGYNAEFEAWQDTTYDEDTGAGWMKPPKGSPRSPGDHPEMGPLFGGGWRGSGSATFRLDHINGRVLCNVLLSGADGPVDCRVRVNKEPARRVRLEAGERRTVTIPAVIRDGRLDVAVSGVAWTLSGIVPQLFMSQEEDYLFDRTWWAFGQQPWAWNAFKGKTAWAEYPAKY